MQSDLDVATAGLHGSRSAALRVAATRPSATTEEHVMDFKMIAAAIAAGVAAAIASAVGFNGAIAGISAVIVFVSVLSMLQRPK